MTMITLQNFTAPQLSQFCVVLVSPLEGSAGQVADFVELHVAGVQHVALETYDILDVVSHTKNNQNERASQGKAAEGVNFVAPRRGAWENALVKAMGLNDQEEGVKTELLETIKATKEAAVILDVKVPGDLASTTTTTADSNLKASPYGLLRQVFTLPIYNDCAIFFELIQRDNYQGFATNNIASLFDSLEADLTVLYVDEVLGSKYVDEVIRELVSGAASESGKKWKVDVRKVQNGSNAGKLKEEDLCLFLSSSSLKYDVVVSSFTPITRRVLDSFVYQPRLVQAQVSCDSILSCAQTLFILFFFFFFFEIFARVLFFTNYLFLFASFLFL
jgi:hypothetical protein